VAPSAMPPGKRGGKRVKKEDGDAIIEISSGSEEEVVVEVARRTPQK